MSTAPNDVHPIDRADISWFTRLRRLLPRQWGSLPIILALLLIWGVFQTANPNFLTPLNLTNLLLQITAVGTISAGLILVLLLGEVDLSVGAVSGLCAAIMAVLNVKNEVPGAVAVLIALAAGLGIGLLQGAWITQLRLPSFIVTLAGLLVWQGALIYVLGTTGTVNLTDPFILGLAGTFFSPVVGWSVGAVFILIYVVWIGWARQQQIMAGMMVEPLREMVVRSVTVIVGMIAITALLNANRGLPSAVIFFVGIIVVFDFITKRTVFGSYIFSVGSNAEAARRAGIDVALIRVVTFGLASMLAAMGGILAASRLLAVNQSSGSSDLLLNAIAAAVIGGTSFFGGRGTVWAAFLGMLVIGSISNGLDLLALASPIKSIITGGVLLLAVTIDVLARRRHETAES